MNIANITLRDDTGIIWTGSALAFCRDNGFERGEVADMCASLRASGAWACGGGAAPNFVVSLA